MFCSKTTCCCHANSLIEDALRDAVNTRMSIWDKLTGDQCIEISKRLKAAVDDHIPEGAGYVKDGIFIPIKGSTSLYYACFKAVTGYLDSLLSTDKRGQFVR